MVLGLFRTVPYLQTYGTDALRDGTLWGYGIFALIVFVLLDRDWVLRLFKLYGFMAVTFLVWGPIAYFLFVNYTAQTEPGSFVYSSTLIPNAPGSNVPILFFKAQDMAVQTAGAIAFLVLGTPLWSRVRDFLWRARGRAAGILDGLCDWHRHSRWARRRRGNAGRARRGIRPHAELGASRRRGRSIRGHRHERRDGALDLVCPWSRRIRGARRQPGPGRDPHTRFPLLPLPQPRCLIGRNPETRLPVSGGKVSSASSSTR